MCLSCVRSSHVELLALYLIIWKIFVELCIFLINILLLVLDCCVVTDFCCMYCNNVHTVHDESDEYMQPN